MTNALENDTSMNKNITIICGINAAGKSTLVEDYVSKGYARVNRDFDGSSLDECAISAKNLIRDFHNPVVLDNTYPSVKSRASIISTAKTVGVPIHCVHLTTSMEDAQLNACLRMIRRTGKILGPEDFKKFNDPNLFPPAAIYHYRKEFQKPTKAEGFASVTEVPFVRQWGREYNNKAILVDYDGTLRLSTGTQKYPVLKSDIKILPKRAEILNEYKKNGYYILGVSNQSGVAKKVITHEECTQRFVDTNKMLGNLVDEFMFCPHSVPPIVCYCRKPAPGLGAYFIEKYKLNPANCLMVGDMTSDKTFAGRCGFEYEDANEFFT